MIRSILHKNILDLQEFKDNKTKFIFLMPQENSKVTKYNCFLYTQMVF